MVLAWRQHEGGDPTDGVGDDAASVPKPPPDRSSASRSSRCSDVSSFEVPYGLLTSADVDAIEERHAQLHAILLHQCQQPLPHAQPGPADEHLICPSELSGCWHGSCCDPILPRPRNGTSVTGSAERLRRVTPRPPSGSSRIQCRRATSCAARQLGCGLRPHRPDACPPVWRPLCFEG